MPNVAAISGSLPLRTMALESTIATASLFSVFSNVSMETNIQVRASDWPCLARSSNDTADGFGLNPCRDKAPHSALHFLRISNHSSGEGVTGSRNSTEFDLADMHPPHRRA